MCTLSQVCLNKTIQQMYKNRKKNNITYLLYRTDDKSSLWQSSNQRPNQSAQKPETINALWPTATTTANHYSAPATSGHLSATAATGSKAGTNFFSHRQQQKAVLQPLIPKPMTSCKMSSNWMITNEVNALCKCTFAARCTDDSIP